MGYGVVQQMHLSDCVCVFTLKCENCYGEESLSVLLHFTFLLAPQSNYGIAAVNLGTTGAYPITFV